LNTRLPLHADRALDGHHDYQLGQVTPIGVLWIDA
jgi:hypothetical protein